MEIFEIILIIISVLIVVVGLSIYFILRHLKGKNKYDFITKYGTKVTLSPQTSNFTVEIFDLWSSDIVAFWNEKKGWDKEKCYEQLKHTEIKIYDQEYLERSGHKVSGMIWPNSLLVEITSFPKGTNKASAERIASLFRHEISHIMAKRVGNVEFGPMGEYHHKLFSEVNLGA